VFWDPDYGGVYWSVNKEGSPVIPRKHHYAQAFAIYGMAEYHRATRELESLELGQTLFHLLEQHAHDALHEGYIEGSSRAWEALDDMRLSDREINCHKTMNTMLHILEAYTNLLRVWDGAHLRKQHRALVDVFLQNIFDPRTGHLRLFFDDQWNSLSENESYGHDIEASWLLVEAAAIQGDSQLVEQVHQSAVAIADAVYRDGIDNDGSVYYEGGPQGLVDTSKSWWVQVEAMVGFYSAFELTGQSQFAEAAHRCWQYIKANLVDRTHGDWFKLLHRDGTPDETCFKAGPWEDPYHHSRACFELIRRLDG
jgi:mannobiose 2-epimerase